MLLTHSSPDGHLERFQFSATKNSAYNEHPPCTGTQTFSEYTHPKVERTTKSHGTHACNFSRYLQIVPHNSLAPMAHDHSHSHITLPTLDNVRLLHFCRLGSIKIEFHLITNEVQYLFHMIFNFFELLCHLSFACFHMGLTFFLIVAYLYLFCILILYISQLYVSMHIIIFSQTL